MTDDDVQSQAMRVVLAAVDVVRAHPRAVVEIVVSSDRNGTVHIRESVSSIPLEALKSCVSCDNR